jgi:hypothetical protein
MSERGKEGERNQKENFLCFMFVDVFCLIMEGERMSELIIRDISLGVNEISIMGVPFWISMGEEADIKRLMSKLRALFKSEVHEYTDESGTNIAVENEGKVAMLEINPNKRMYSIVVSDHSLAELKNWIKISPLLRFDMIEFGFRNEFETVADFGSGFILSKLFYNRNHRILLSMEYSLNLN